MRWILFILFCLLGAPAHAVSIPGVTTTTTTDSTTEPAPEPDIEQKKAAYGALADVLDNCKRSPKSAAIMVKPFPPASGSFIAISPAPRISRLIHKPSAMR